MKKIFPHVWLILGLVIFDQATKILISRKFGVFGSVTIIPGFFRLSRVHNKGAIFGAFGHMPGSFAFWILTAASLIALGMVVYYFFVTPPSQKGMKIALSLILAGALGNLADRVFRGYVLDFLELHAGRFYWPTFNAADSCITIGAVLLVFFFWVKRPHASHPD
jgi:signal peptidase II